MAQAARIHGRLSQHTSGDEVFDIETEALFGTRPEVRTFVFRSGQIVGKIVWPLTIGNTLEGTRLVNLQHERVLRGLRRGKDVASMGIPESRGEGRGASTEAAVVTQEGDETSASIDLGFEWSDSVLVDEVIDANSARPSGGVEIVPEVVPAAPAVVSAEAAMDSQMMEQRVQDSSAVAVAQPVDPLSDVTTRVTSPAAEDSSLTGRLLRSGVVQRAAVIDDEGTLLAEVGDGAELIELAFLATGLESLLSETLSLGECESTTIERQDHTVLVLHEGALICAFVPTGRLPRTRLVDAARQALRGATVQ